MTTRYLSLCLYVLLLLLWAPSLAFAQVVASATAGGLSVPLSLVIISAFLSSLSGATALALRIDMELRANEGRPLLRPWLFCSAHMLGSWLAGTVGFIVGQQLGWDVWGKLGLVIVASFMGAKFIEAMAEKYLARVGVALDAIKPKEG